MVLTEITNNIELNANEVSFIASLFIFSLFYYQYKKYEAQIESEELVERFLEEQL